MDFSQFFDLLLRIDQILAASPAAIAQYGVVIYAVLVVIVFAETGLVIFPFLPGDTLLFIAGAFCASGAMDIWILMTLLTVAAVTGNTVNYWVGRAIGHKVFTHDYKWLDKQALEKTHAFYEKHGGKTMILARFVPVVRTFAPFVAGVSEMTFAKFQFFNVTGALLWVVGLCTAGYFFGDIPIIKQNLDKIVLLGVAVAVVPLVLGGMWKFYRKMSRKQG